MNTRKPGIALAPHPRGSLLTIAVTPRSSKNQIEQATDGAWRARITAPPVEGEANAAVLRLLADAIDVPRSRLGIVSGHSGRTKRILIEGLSPEELARRLIARDRDDPRHLAS